jgi:hypothetical protein
LQKQERRKENKKRTKRDQNKLENKNFFSTHRDVYKKDKVMSIVLKVYISIHF